MQTKEVFNLVGEILLGHKTLTKTFSFPCHPPSWLELMTAPLILRDLLLIIGSVR